MVSKYDDQKVKQMQRDQNTKEKEKEEGKKESEWVQEKWKIKKFQESSDKERPKLMEKLLNLDFNYCYLSLRSEPVGK